MTELEILALKRVEQHMNLARNKLFKIALSQNPTRVDCKALEKDLENALGYLRRNLL